MNTNEVKHQSMRDATKQIAIQSGIYFLNL